MTDFYRGLKYFIKVDVQIYIWSTGKIIKGYERLIKYVFSIYINNIGMLPVVNIGHLPLDKAENRLLKRAFDIVFASLFFSSNWYLVVSTHSHFDKNLLQGTSFL